LSSVSESSLPLVCSIRRVFQAIIVHRLGLLVSFFSTSLSKLLNTAFHSFQAN